MKFLPVLVLFAAAAGARAQETAQPQQAQQAQSQQVQQQPEFNGTWRLDADRSRLDDVKTPKVSLLKIEQHDPKVKFTITTGERKKEVTDTFELTPDGTVERSRWPASRRPPGRCTKTGGWC